MLTTNTKAKIWGVVAAAGSTALVLLTGNGPITKERIEHAAVAFVGAFLTGLAGLFHAVPGTQPPTS